MALLSRAAQFSATERGVTRLYLSPEHRAIMTWLMGLMSDIGLSVELDPAGSVVGRLASDQPDAPTLIIGSHQDSVKEGGAYDGILGVILPLVCLETLVQRGQKLGIKKVDDGIWLVSFMHHDLGYIDLEQKTLQTIDNPFGTRVSPMS